VTESDFLQAGPEREMYEVAEMKLKKQWRPQAVGDARNRGHLPRKATKSEKSLPTGVTCGNQPARL
jgi:hypothetical protein